MATKRKRYFSSKPRHTLTGNVDWVDGLELQIHPDHRSIDNGGESERVYHGSLCQYNGEEDPDYDPESLAY